MNSDKRVRAITLDEQNRRLHTLPVWARDRVKSAEARAERYRKALEEWIAAEDEQAMRGREINERLRRGETVTLTVAASQRVDAAKAAARAALRGEG